VDRFWLWVEDDRPAGGFFNLKSTLQHFETFWARRDLPNVHLFHYADLQADLEGELRRLAGALGVDVDDDLIRELAEAAGFERMRDRAADLAPQVKIDGFWHNTSNFFHAGATGQWEALMTPTDAERYDARVRGLGSPDVLAWAHGGNRSV
jgi:hypothetical protein